MSLCSTAAFSSDETIPPRSWVYGALRHFELLGVINLETAAPYSRTEVEAYVIRILDSTSEDGFELSPRQRYLLGRLEAEFIGNDLSPEEREDPPVWSMSEDNRFFAVDLEAGAALLKREEFGKGEINGLLIPTFLLGLGGMVTFEADYLVVMGPERDDPCPQRSCSRVKSWRGLTSEYERGYFALHGRGWRIQLGRDYIQWGSMFPGGLLMSTTGCPHDHIGFDISMGRFTLRSFQAVLDPYVPRRLAGHRLEIRLPARMTAAVSETVLYTGRDFDWGYFVPFGAYYANQYNEREDDNILWSVDMKFPVTKGLMLSGELLLDDIQYESDPPAPEKIGWTLRADVLVMPWGHEVTLDASYTRIGIYTYSHKDSLLSAYVTGGGDKVAGEIIGDHLGPDADRWLIGVSTPLHPRALLSLEGVWIRRGEGNDMREWHWDQDPDPPFPSGVVIDERIYTASMEIDLGGGSYIEASGGVADPVVCSDGAREGFGSISFVWDF